MRQKFDVVVIGSGPAGQRAAIQAAKLGRQVLVIEKDSIGGACFHSGTLPSKTLREAVIRKARTGQSPQEIFRYAMDTKDRVLVEECRVLEDQLARNQVSFLQGRAVFESSHTVKVLTPTGTLSGIEFQNAIVATGSRPNVFPDWIPRDDRIRDSDTILNLMEMPKRLLVMGAGVIGCEYASIFASMGIAVILFDRREKLLRGLDTDIQEALLCDFRAQGMEIVLGAAEPRLEARSDHLLLNFADETRKVDAVLVCLGRESLSRDLGIAEIGLATTDRGLISVNEHYQSSVEHIYAVGDVVGPPGLAASAAEQGRLAALHVCTGENPQFSKFFPTGIYTIPEVSVVGTGEEELKAAKADFVVGRARFKELARGKILGDENGYLKLMVCRGSRKILGVQILGTNACELVHLGQLAMALDGGLEVFLKNIFNYPTLAEAYKVAALNAHNQLELASPAAKL